MNEGGKSKTLRLIPKSVAFTALLAGIVYSLLRPPQGLSIAVLQLLVIILTAIITFVLFFIIIHGWEFSKDEFNKYFVVHHEWLIILILLLALGFFFGLQSFGYRQDNTEVSARYIMSAVFQGLAALFALTFTITLIVLQVSHKHTGLIERFFNDWFNILYPITNGIFIIFPIIALRLELYSWGTNITITGAFICVFWVIPFIYRTKDFIKYYIGIEEFFRKAREAILQGDKDQCQQITDRTVSFFAEAIDRGNYGIAKFTIHEMLALSEFIYNVTQEVDNLVDNTVLNSMSLIIIPLQKQIVNGIWFGYNDFEKIVNIIDKIPFTKKVMCSTIISTLIEMVTYSPNIRTKRIICSGLWLFSAKWLTANPGHLDTIMKSIKNLLAKISVSFFLKCNNPHGRKSFTENAYWKLYDNPAQQKKLRELYSLVKKNLVF